MNEAQGPVSKAKLPPQKRATSRSLAPTSFAKITQPAVPRSYLRERVFELLDGLSDRRLLWLAAPAGYGKTTAISSYLRARNRPTAWYQCDEGDADVASFFFHLSMAREKLVSGSPPPAFAPEHFAQIPTFTRNFFRAWFAGLPQGATLVLDNVQDVPAEATLQQVLPIIGEQIPEGAQLVVISRLDPDAAMSRLAANEQMAVVGRQQLQLSRAETAAIVGLNTPQGELVSRLSNHDLYEVTQGWAAGLTVMIRHAGTGAGGSGTTSSGRPSSPQALFNYLAVEVFDRLDAPVREFLLKTACLDHITVPVAQHVSGNVGAEGILQALLRQNAFTVYRPGPESYHYHPLFRDFLLKRLDATLSAAEQRELLGNAARSLQTNQDTETAIGLFLRASQWQEAVPMILMLAPALVQQVKVTRLASWLDALPAELVSGNGWLSYWRGVLQMTTQFPAARNCLEHAYRLFVIAGDELGQMLACAGVMQHITYCYADCSPLPRWIDILDALLARPRALPSPSFELLILSGFLLALSMVNAKHPAFRRTLQRVEQLLASDIELASRAAAISALQHYYGGVGRPPQYGALDEQVVQVLADPALGPAMRLHIMWMQAWQLFLSGETTQALAILGESRDIARHHNLTNEELQLQLATLQARGASVADVDTALEFSRLEPVCRRLPPILAAHFLYIRALCELAAGNTARALTYSQESLEIMHGCRWPPAESILWAGFAEIHCELGNFAEAERCLVACEEFSLGLDAPLPRFSVGLARAEIARRKGREAEFAELLAGALAIGRKQGFVHTYHGCSNLLPRLVPYALQLSIEVPYCRLLIGKRGIRPPASDLPQWPWKVKIRAMGRLDIAVDEVPLTFTGKAQRKPLDLLKTLLTHSRGIEATAVMDLLWPELDGDSARNSLDLATHRLRKLLGYKESVLAVQGRLVLNPDSVWVDAFALERLGAGSLLDERPPTAAHLLTLYRGPLLLGETLAPVVAARDRLRGQFVRAVRTLIDRLGASADWDALTSLCLRAIEIEPLEETLYRDWMQQLLACGQDAQAALIYKRCERTLERALGRKPSPATRRLVDDGGFH